MYVANHCKFTLSSTASNVTDKVTIIANSDGIHSMSKIYDYIYRPPEFENYSLYEYLRMTKIIKISRCAKSSSLINHDNHDTSSDSNTDSESNTSKHCNKYKNVQQYCFLDKHPQHKSHYVIKLSPKHLYVLNFVGTNLPQQLDDNMEYYSIVMITIFNPQGWREPVDIKSDSIC